jgi:glutamyl-tRNA reductase
MAAEQPQLFVAGLSHKTAPVALRERLSPGADRVPELLRELVRPVAEGSNGMIEAVLVVTCNRFEIYGLAHRGPVELSVVNRTVRESLGVDLTEHEGAVYLHEGDEVVGHLLRVAASLDSLVVGESQILGQVKEAYRVATEAGTAGKILNRLFHRAIEAGKRVRTETRIGHNAVSVSYAAVELAKKCFGRVEDRKALVIGVGEMSELTAQHLKANGVTELIVTNRTLLGAVNMADRFGGRAIEFEKFPSVLDQVDIVISATGAKDPILRAADVEAALVRRRQRPLFIIDIALPRDVEPAVGDLPNAYLFNIDDLQTVADKNYRERVAEAHKAEELVRDEAGKFARWLRTLKAVPVLERLRSLGAQLVADELARLQWRLDRLEEREQRAVSAAVNSVVGKLLHRPLVNIKKLAQEDDAEILLGLVEDLFFEDPDAVGEEPAEVPQQSGVVPLDAASRRGAGTP